MPVAKSIGAHCLNRPKIRLLSLLASSRRAVEKVVARFWGDALKIEAPEVHDDFAELGGDSLQAAQIVGRIQELFPLDQPLVTLGQATTIEELAGFIIAHERVPGQSEQIATIFLRVEGLPAAAVVKALQKYQGSASDG